MKPGHDHWQNILDWHKSFCKFLDRPRNNYLVTEVFPQSSQTLTTCYCYYTFMLHIQIVLKISLTKLGIFGWGDTHIHHFEEKCLSTFWHINQLYLTLTLTNFQLLTLCERFSIFYNTKPHIFMKFIVVIREDSLPCWKFQNWILNLLILLQATSHNFVSIFL